MIEEHNIEQHKDDPVYVKGDHGWDYWEQKVTLVCSCGWSEVAQFSPKTHIKEHQRKMIEKKLGIIFKGYPSIW